MNPFEYRCAYEVNAELLNFVADNLHRIKDVKGVLKDIAIDCTHLTTHIDFNKHLYKYFIRIDPGGYTESMSLVVNSDVIKIDGCICPDNDSIYITCIEFEPNAGHGCKWIETTYEKIMKEAEEWKKANAKEHKLVNGRIPAHTECPYKSKCAIGLNDNCYHQGERHTCDFSCATARGFAIIERDNDE